MSGAYYNEFDPYKAAAIREAIQAGAITDGDVDERSIADVQPGDLLGYTQCHFFAGGGFWSLALRNAGWPDGRPVWTGSCPCPSFSAAGKGGGFDDPRHLWPDWARLIRERKPPVLFGEQADDAIGYGWLDLVQTDLEAEAYAVGKAVLGAASVGAPHIRQRTYFVADTPEQRHDGRRASEAGRRKDEPERSRDAGELGNASGEGLSKRGGDGGVQRDQVEPLQGQATIGRGPIGGFWRDAEWIPCRHPKIPGAVEWRAIKPGTFPLASGYPGRVGLIRLAGDAICVPVATEFIRAYMEARA